MSVQRKSLGRGLSSVISGGVKKKRIPRRSNASIAARRQSAIGAG